MHASVRPPTDGPAVAVTATGRVPHARVQAAADVIRWHLVTGSYAPELGGVADFTRQLAAGLAGAGDEVHVWCPRGDAPPPVDAGVTVHPLMGRFDGAALRALDAGIDAIPGPRRILVQWVPHALGRRSLNVGFAWWLWRRGRGDDVVEVVAHEGGLGFGEGGLLHTAAAVVHRLMALLAVRAARRVWVTIPEWARRWKALAAGKRVDFRWLPIPSTIPVADDAAAVARVRARHAAADEPLVVHFGTYGAHHMPQLVGTFGALLDAHGRARLLLLGPGGERLRDALVDRDPRVASRTDVTGALPPATLSAYIAAADLVVQPYTDGVSARRTSVMAPLEHGRPVVSTTGFLTEPLWAASDALALAPADDPAAIAASAARLLDDAAERARLGEAGRRLYSERFAMSHAVRALRDAGQPTRTTIPSGR